MTGKTAAEAAAVLDDDMDALHALIQEVILHCETQSDFDTLAGILLTKSVDILESTHGDGCAPVVRAILQDRRAQRGIPTLPESIRQFLP